MTSTLDLARSFFERYLMCNKLSKTVIVYFLLGTIICCTLGSAIGSAIFELLLPKLGIKLPSVIGGVIGSTSVAFYAMRKYLHRL
jgi:uncharacterized membrane protein YeaQ/YmgE (transglycosylase-associated protein family)